MTEAIGPAVRMDAVDSCEALHARRTLRALDSRYGHRPQWCRSWTSVQLEPGSLLVASTVRRLPGLRLRQTAVDSTSLHRICSPPNSTSLLLSSSRSGVQFVEGHALTSDRCVILDRDTEIELIAHSGSSWVLISLASNLVHGVTVPAYSSDAPLHSGVHIVKRSMNACVALAREATSALAVIGSYSVASAARALAISMLRDDSDNAGGGTCGAMRDAPARRRIAVERARKYIWEHLADPIRLADLCAHAHLQARSLEYGFRELVRLSPMGYVRMLRLGAVRAQLIADLAALRSISEIALDAGFSHLSQFVVDYRHVFGETPSTTRYNVMHAGEPEISRRRQRRAVMPSPDPTLWAGSVEAVAYATVF